MTRREGCSSTLAESHSSRAGGASRVSPVSRRIIVVLGHVQKLMHGKRANRRASSGCGSGSDSLSASARHRLIRPRKRNSAADPGLRWLLGKGERTLPGHADCDPSVADSQLTLVKKPRRPLLASCCLLLLMEIIRSTVKYWRPVSGNCLRLSRRLTAVGPKLVAAAFRHFGRAVPVCLTWHRWLSQSEVSPGSLQEPHAHVGSIQTA